MNYKTVDVKKGDTTFVFVTRGRSKKFTQDEIDDYFSTTTRVESNRWAGIPDTKQRKVMFIKDLKLGLDFCVGKYGATKAEIIAEAQRIAPFFNPGA